MINSILQTSRLILRTWQDEDLEPMTIINQDPKVYEFLAGPANLNETRTFIEKIRQHSQEKGFSLYAVELKSTHEMIGFVGLLTPSFEAHFTPCIEIGWRLASTHWNQGYATEAATAVLHYAFTQLNLNEVVSFTATGNQRSRRVMEKIGLHYNPQDDFDHPKITKNHRLCRHVLYRMTKNNYLKIC